MGLLLAQAVLLAACSREGAPAASGGSPAQGVRVASAIAADVPLEIAAIGNVEAMSSVEVKARVTAPVVEVKFAEGQEVRKGDLLFELDAEPFRRQIAQIEIGRAHV